MSRNYLNRLLRDVVWRLVRCSHKPCVLKCFGEPLFWLTGFRHFRSNAGKAPRRILVVKLDRLGDLVLCSDFLRNLRRSYPNSEITLAVRESLADLACLSPDIDSVTPVPVDEGSMVHTGGGYYHRWSDQIFIWLRLCLVSGWWSRRFDVAVIPRRDTDWYGATALAYLSGAVERFGIFSDVTATKHNSNRFFDTLLTNAVKDSAEGHELHSSAPILRAMEGEVAPPALSLWTNLRTCRAASEILRNVGVGDDQRLMFLCLGAGETVRRWPVERYSEVCLWFYRRFKQRIVVIGTSEEGRLGDVLCGELGDWVIRLEGKIPIDVLPAIMSHAWFYLGSDTGPMHLAAAAKRPVVMISCHPKNGSPLEDTSPARFGPFGVECRVVQPESLLSPCQGRCCSDEPHCILAVTSGKVIAAVDDLIQEIGMASPARSS